MAAIGWEAAVTALDAGELLASGGEWGMLRLGASPARDIPVGLGDAVTGIDPGNAIPFSCSSNVSALSSKLRRPSFVVIEAEATSR